ncbi:unnamed protein product, partial [Bubo scandiacus]
IFFQAKHGRPSRTPAPAAAQRHSDEPAETDITSAKAGVETRLKTETSLLGTRHRSLLTGERHCRWPSMGKQKTTYYLTLIVTKLMQSEFTQEIASRNPGGKFNLLNTIVLTYLPTGTLIQPQSTTVESNRPVIREEGTYANTKVSGRKEKGARYTRAETALQPMVRGQAVPLQPVEVHGRAGAHMQPAEGVFQVFQKVTEILL